MRARVYKAMKGVKKSQKTMDLIGCDSDHLRIYIASLFKPGMSWDNHGRGEGKWNIDHIKPCAKFNLIDTEQQKACFHYTNLQPMWHTDNMKKRDRFEPIKSSLS